MLYITFPCLIYFIMAPTVKHLSTMQETWVRSLGWEDPLAKAMEIHSSTIAWEIPWTEEPGRLQSMGSQRVGHDWVTWLSPFSPISPTLHHSNPRSATLTTTDLLSVSMIQRSMSIMPSKYTHVVTNGKISFPDFYPFTHQRTQSLFHNKLVGFLATIKMLCEISLQISFQVNIFISLDTYPEVELLGHMIVPSFNFFLKRNSWCLG